MRDRSGRDRAPTDHPALPAEPGAARGAAGRRRFLGQAAALPAALACAAAGAQPAGTWPTQPIRWIVPYPPGGGTDVLARTLADALRASLGQPVLIENRPGAATNIGAEIVARAKPDGYTVMSADNAVMTFNEHLFRKLPFDPERDFSYVHAIGRFPLALVVHPSFPARNLREFLGYVRANPGKVNYASPGNGSPHHVGMELLEQVAKIHMVHVPYRGAAPALQDLLSGQVQTMMLDLVSGLSTMRTDKLRVLAIGSTQRSGALPAVPTLAESGLNGVDVFAFQAVLGPAGLPSEAAQRLSTELSRALKDPAILKRFGDYGLEPLDLGGEELRRFARAESARWGKVIRTANISLD